MVLGRKPKNYLKMTESESTLWNKNNILISRQLTSLYLRRTNYKWHKREFSWQFLLPLHPGPGKTILPLEMFLYWFSGILFRGSTDNRFGCPCITCM